MDTDAWFTIGLFTLALLITAFAAAAETVLTSISRLRAMAMLEEGVSKGRSFELFMNEPGTFLTAIILLNTFTIVVAASLSSMFAVRQFGTTFATIAAIIGSFVLILLFQVIPKSLAARDPDKVAGWIATPVRLLSTLLFPLTALVRGISRLFTHGSKDVRDTPLVTEEELRMLVNVSEEEGIIEEEEREMIRGIFDLEETVVRALMVPRIDIAAVPIEASIADVVKVIVDLGYSRIPVYEGSIDNIIGIIYAKDLFQFLLPMARQVSNRSTLVANVPPLREILRPPHFIPESKKVDVLLRELQGEKVHIAIVVDEYGGTAGLVTIEDLLEEIVGEIQDEYDREDAPMNRISDSVLSVDGRVSLDDVNEELGVHLAAEEYDTIGGLVLELRGQVPPAGDVLDVTDQDENSIQIAVLDTDGRRIKRLKLTKQTLSTTLDSRIPAIVTTTNSPEPAVLPEPAAARVYPLDEQSNASS